MEIEDDYVLGDDDYDELLGDEYELLGARRRRRPKTRRKRPRAILNRRQFTRERGLVLGFGTQNVGIGVTQDFTANPQVPFRPKRIVIQSTSNLGDFIVEDVRVGKNSQLASAAGFPGSAFVNNAFDIGVMFDTAWPGIDIVVTVTNSNAAAQDITVGMFGYAAER